MGNAWRRIRSYNNKEVRILMIGLDAAGKTSTLYKLRLGEVVTTIPTIGFNVETVEYKNINFTALDVGGRGMIRPLMRHYYRNTDVIMFLLDSNDRDRISECKDELWRLLSEDELRSSHLLVMANKQDLPNAMSIEEVTEKMGLHNIRNREWYIQGTCAITGEGLYEGLSWLQSTLTQKEVKKAVVKPVKEVVNSVQPEDAPSKPEGKPNTSSWWAMLNSYFKTVAVS